jgi:hypothetical protein
MVIPMNQQSGKLNQMRKRAKMVRRPQITAYVLSSWRGLRYRILVGGTAHGCLAKSLGMGFCDAMVSFEVSAVCDLHSYDGGCCNFSI